MRKMLMIMVLCLLMLSLWAQNEGAGGKVILPVIQSTEVPQMALPKIIDRNEPKEGIPVQIPEPTFYKPVIIDRNEPKIGNPEPTPFTVPPELIPVVLDRYEPKESVAKPGGRPPAVDPDAWEPDNSATQYTSISVRSIEESQLHTIHVDTDQDWFRFMGYPGRIYTFYSTGTIDAMIYLYSDDGITLYDWDDDDGDGNNFNLQFSPVTMAYYKLRVNAYTGQLGFYTIHYVFGATVDSYEPDDSAAQANLISPLIALTSENHTLHSNTDQDWYAFSAATGLVYTFESTGTTDTQIYLYESNGTTLVDWDDDDGVDFNFYLQFSPPADAMYRIKIVPFSGSGGVYVFNYSYNVNPDSYEPDDSVSDYTEISVSPYHNLQNHTLHSTSDQDWYRVFMSSGNIYSFGTTGGVDTRAFLYNDAGTIELTTDDDDGDWLNFSLTYSPAASGYYKLKVDGLGYSVGTYDLHYWWELPPDGFEPDDSAGDPCTIIPVYTVFSHIRNLHNNLDQDWLVFQGVPGRVYTFYSTSDIDTRVYLFQEDGTTQLDWDDDDGDGNNFYLQFAPAILANYKLKIDGYSGVVGAYTFYFNNSAPLDDFEPDNSASQYTTIQFSSSTLYQNHTLHSDTDQDWFRFYAVAGVGKLYNISTSGNMDTRGYLYMDNGSTLVDWDDNDGVDNNFILLLNPTTTGWYKVKIVSNNGTVGAYQFRCIMEAYSDAYEPDNSAAQYTNIMPSTGTQFQYHSTHHSGDEDWYRFYGTAGKTYTFHSVGTVDTWANLFQSDGTTLILQDDDSAGYPNFRLIYTPTVTAYYLIQVYALGGEVGDYQMHYIYGAAADSYEPDNSVADPSPLSVLASVQSQDHTLHTITDQDWYRFQGLAGRSYHFYSTGATDTQIYLYADNGTTQIAWDDDSAGAPNYRLNYTPATTAWYTLKVKGYNGDVGMYGFCYNYSIGLAVPQNLTITRSGNNLTISWGAVPGAVSYVIETSSEPYTGFSSIGATTYTSWPASVSNGPMYFRVRASDQPVP